MSWAIPIDQKLVTRGQSRYARYPFYTGYFLMFVGLFLTWFNLLAIILLLGIPGWRARLSYGYKFTVAS